MDSHDQRLEWIREYAEGTALPETIARLEQSLRDDPEFRAVFLEYLNLDVALLTSAATAVVEPEEQQCDDGEALYEDSIVFRRWWFAAAALAACAAVLLTLIWWRNSAQPFATVAGGAGIENLATGAKIHGEQYELNAGVIDFVTARGARVTVEAPAAFRFESTQRLRLFHGRVAADVPPSAKGFTVITPTGKAVDFGTKFGVDVPLHGEAEVHVFQGKVVAQPSGGGKHRSLCGGEAFALAAGAGTVRELRSAAFVGHEEVALMRAALASGQRDRSARELEKVRRDPALIAMLDFESSTLPSGNYRVVQGRWPGSHAPEFVNVADHMKLDVGGASEWQQLTLAAWVRLDRLGAPFQSLFHTDGWSQENPGQVHWMITRAMTMRLALFGNKLSPGSIAREPYPDSRTSVLPEQGRWVHLAVVYDAPKRVARFYLNGQLDNEVRLEIAHPARLGPAQIGNWDRQDRKLSGRMDEFVILGRAMNDDEVKTLYGAGTPYL